MSRVWFTMMALLALVLNTSGPAQAGGWDDPGFNAYSEEDYEIAIAAWQPFEEQTDPSTLIRIGWMHKFGEGMEVDCRRAAYFFSKAAKAGDPWSQFNLADLYHYGDGNVDEDLVEAYMWYALAINGGYERTNTRLAQITPKMTAEQIARAKKAAEVSPYRMRTSDDKIMAKTLRDAKNMFQQEYMRARNKEVGERNLIVKDRPTRTAGDLIGELYQSLLNLPDYMASVLATEKERNYSAVDKNKTKKAPENIPVSKFYLYGEKLEAKYTEAAGKFEKAALKGDASAAANLGFLYFFGNGVPIDVLKSHMWFDLANQGGVKRARFLLAQVEERMTAEQVEEATRMADDWMAQLPEG
jgi:uncharacterized protein